jgi:putative aldouronate transport system substrate-binding protein
MTSFGAVSAGIQNGYHWTETLAKDLGIQLDIVPSSTDNMKAMIAARDLPEFISNASTSDTTDIIRAGLVQDLEIYKDRLPNVFKWTGMIQFMRDYWSEGSGKVYAVRGDIGNVGSTAGVSWAGAYGRWDYYKELGYPAITDLEDYLTVLKAMQDRHPTNDAGQRAYALSIFPDWDGLYMSFGTIFTAQLGKRNIGGYLEADLETDALNSMLDDNSTYKRQLKFLYTANKMGLLDPDSPTQTYDIYREKGAAGRHILSWGWWWNDNLVHATELANQGKGFMLLPFKNSKIENQSTAPYVGRDNFYMINNRVQHLDKILEFLDYCYSPDGMMKLYYGPKGVAWDVDASGQPFRTEFGWRYVLDRSTEIPPGGGWSVSGYVWASNVPFISPWNIHPAWNRRLDGEDWIKKDFAPADSALLADWKRVMGAESDLEYYSKNNMLISPSYTRLPATPDEILLLQQRVGAVVAPESWKIIYAANDAEFESIWRKMVADAKGIGADTINQYYADAYRKAVADGARYVY